MTDTINNLPDEILSHILSFLTTKEAASTFVLSKRWRNLFNFTPNLTFDDYEYRNHKNNSNYSGFIEFVDRVLAMSGDFPVKKFTLKHRQKFDEARVNTWICTMLNRGVMDLDLFLILKDGYSLPLEVFSCKTIVEMKLGSLFGITKVHENASLPALKTLVLGSVWFSGYAFEALLSACHVLEELTIIGTPWVKEHEKQCFTISCPTLLRLIIHLRHCDVSQSLILDTPSLAYLEYKDSFVDEYRIVNLNSLVVAKLSLHYMKGNPTNLIKSLRNVVILELSCTITSQMFHSFYEAIPVFEKLSTLSIATDSESCLMLLPLLLKNSPNLETLVIKGPLYFYEKYQEEYGLLERLSWYYYLMSCHVKVLEITEYCGTKRDLQQMKHFLEKLPCLELVKVRACTNANTKLPFPTDLLMLPRTCTMELINFLPQETI